MAKQKGSRKYDKKRKSAANAAYKMELRHDRHKRLRMEKEARRQKEYKTMRTPRGTARRLRRIGLQKAAA